jgi:3-hydroxybutyryl-CoA dehydrogenase
MTEAAPPVYLAAVVGGGTMGSGIAQALATSGAAVWLVDVGQTQLDRARSTIERSLARLVERGTVAATARDETLRRITYATELDQARDAQVLVEAVFEESAAKRSVLQEAARLLPPSALLASNTSSISITALAAGLPHPERVVGMHFFNPVPVMSLVEVVRGELSSDEAVNQTVDLAEQLGKTPVVVNDYPGFVANRILLPMLNEAFYALMEGVAEREAIDQVIKLGLNHPMGPLQLADLIGLDVCLHILEVLHRDLGDDKYRPCPLLRRLVAAGKLGRKSGAGFYTYAGGG